MGSIYAGGILGYATGDTEVSYCVNTGNMILGSKSWWWNCRTD